MSEDKKKPSKKKAAKPKVAKVKEADSNAVDKELKSLGISKESEVGKTPGKLNIKQGIKALKKRFI
jgi:hypothetical protein